LPFENESVDEIYSRHIVEHFAFREFLDILVEWNRVLRINGELNIICPNLLWHAQQIVNGTHGSVYDKRRGHNDRYWALGSLFGWQQDEYDVHKFGYYFELLRDVLEGAGFGFIENRTNTPDSYEKALHHLEVRAYKVRNYTDAGTHPMFGLFAVEH
jgi:predicted SAM-dependent methyltransferase